MLDINAPGGHPTGNCEKSELPALFIRGKLMGRCACPTIPVQLHCRNCKNTTIEVSHALASDLISAWLASRGGGLPRPGMAVDQFSPHRWISHSDENVKMTVYSTTFSGESPITARTLRCEVASLSMNDGWE
jgi:hypothetical protein